MTKTNILGEYLINFKMDHESFDECILRIGAVGYNIIGIVPLDNIYEIFVSTFESPDF